ncbi:HTH-type transcriptional regulator MetR [Bienertia sinuspersici]
MDRSLIRKLKLGDPDTMLDRGREKLPCPCHNCHNWLHKRVDEILNHLTKSTFDNTYTCWIWHGKK